MYIEGLKYNNIENIDVLHLSFEKDTWKDSFKLDNVISYVKTSRYFDCDSIENIYKDGKRLNLQNFVTHAVSYNNDIFNMCYFKEENYFDIIIFHVSQLYLKFRNLISMEKVYSGNPEIMADVDDICDIGVVMYYSLGSCDYYNLIDFCIRYKVYNTVHIRTRNGVVRLCIKDAQEYNKFIAKYRMVSDI